MQGAGRAHPARRQAASALAEPPLELRKQGQQLIEFFEDGPPVAAPSRVGAENEIVLDGLFGEHQPPLGNEREALLNFPVRVEGDSFLAFEQHMARRRAHDAADSAQNGGLARAIVADDREWKPSATSA